jgi:DcuC family C4-dicarboxylate transporter
MTLAILIILAALFFLIRGYDVRLVLFAAGLALFSIPRWVQAKGESGRWVIDPLGAFDSFLTSMGDTTYVGPICTALAFSSVLAAAGCDREMVRLLMAPIRRVKWGLIPGGCVVGFLTNSAITSQTGAAAAVGPILVPILIAAGVPPVIAGATLVLGCSGGGNLLNMGEPDFVVIRDSILRDGAKISSHEVLSAMLLPELLAFSVAVGWFSFLHRSRQSEPPPPPGDPVTEGGPINLVKALLPPLPVVLLLILQPRFRLWPWLADRYPEGLPVSHAMIFSTIVALLIHRKDISAQARNFFDGMGKAYANIISLIITGRVFIDGIKAVGMITSLVRIVSGQGFWGKLATETFPWTLAVLSGSGIAPCVSFCKAVLPEIAKSDPTGALHLGVLAAVASNFGRTMSPVAAVVMFSSTLVKVSPIDLVKKTAPPLLAGGVVLFFLMLFR